MHLLYNYKFSAHFTTNMIKIYIKDNVYSILLKYSILFTTKLLYKIISNTMHLVYYYKFSIHFSTNLLYKFYNKYNAFIILLKYSTYFATNFVYFVFPL